MNSKMSDHIFHYASYTSHLYQCVDSTRDLIEVTRRGKSSLHYNSLSLSCPWSLPQNKMCLVLSL